MLFVTTSIKTTLNESRHNNLFTCTATLRKKSAYNALLLAGVVFSKAGKPHRLIIVNFLIPLC